MEDLTDKQISEGMHFIKSGYDEGMSICVLFGILQVVITKRDEESCFLSVETTVEKGTNINPDTISSFYEDAKACNRYLQYFKLEKLFTKLSSLHEDQYTLREGGSSSNSIIRYESF